ncbi:DUF4097 family beta strand repeat-containing protein [Plantactinospora soyae]|uniref:DUF4097 and DUF4098 domain-containing protein YvlB n=1 Tax=Plantactinospora soyae TaxID=1544732 RepID=A0A927M350_9ACTN|nr:DUF4097 family beta strand repeat-containing protein [Plantactinospora soyae]MBE1487192.1 DUF4097 and DUF4098 domain-containing protein YvlB [Plantactinospora soyae]
MASWTVDGPRRLTIDEPVDQLVVRLTSGRVNIVGTEGPARIEITQTGRQPVIIEQQDGRLSVRHRKIGTWLLVFRWLTREAGPEVSIAVPATARVDLWMAEGSVVASGLTEATKVDVTSGQVTLMGLSGRTTARLVSGPVEALGVSGDLTMETVSGELILADGSAERVRASTVSGAITCDLDSPGNSEIQLGATSGSVTVRVPEDSDLNVHLHTTSGQISSDFPQLRVGAGLTPVKDSRGVLGAGVGSLRASTVSGSIVLLARRTAE